MKLLIDISESDYEFVKKLIWANMGRSTHKTIQQNIINAIKFGTPIDEITLPDGIVYDPNKYNGCQLCNGRFTCADAFHSNAIHCGAYDKGERE